jgi:hypothetical protein
VHALVALGKSIASDGFGETEALKISRLARIAGLQN